MDEELSQLKGFDIQHLYVQVTDSYLSNPGAREAAIESARALEDVAKGNSRNLIVTIVDGVGEQIYPLKP